jgi:predicted AAA+ superfamily ATPase
MVNKEPGLLSRFWKHNTPEILNTMDDEQVLQLIDEYLERYITSYQKRNPGKDLPNIGTTLAEVRNKRTNISKAPRIIKNA